MLVRIGVYKQLIFPLILMICAGLFIFGEEPKSAFVGSNACIQCHENEGSFFKGTIHEKPFFSGNKGDGCETCHGPGSRHINDPSVNNIVSKSILQKKNAVEKTTMCLKCHKDNITKKGKFSLGTHSKREVTCWDCHNEVLHFYKKEEVSLEDKLSYRIPFQKDNPNGKCLSCHEERLSDIALQFHHPVEKGTILCIDCHEIHGVDKALSIRGGDINGICIKCHREQKGPFAWRHIALEDGCTACHNPHGSVNDKMLVQNGNGLCLQCHYENAFPKVGEQNHRHRLNERARCFDCHSAIHGSNVSSQLLR